MCWSLFLKGYINYCKKFCIFFTLCKNEWKEHDFQWQKDKKSNFYKNKNIVTVKDWDVNKISVPKKEPYGIKGAFKYFIAYNDNDKIRPLCIELPHKIECIDTLKMVTRQCLIRSLIKNF